MHSHLMQRWKIQISFSSLFPNVFLFCTFNRFFLLNIILEQAHCWTCKIQTWILRKYIEEAKQQMEFVKNGSGIANLEITLYKPVLFC
jgi:hypothetical protein